MGAKKFKQQWQRLVFSGIILSLSSGMVMIGLLCKKVSHDTLFVRLTARSEHIDQ